MRQPLTVTLSVGCTLKGVCQDGQYKGSEQNVCMCEMMSKGLKEALTVLIVTCITHVKGVKSVVCGFYAALYTE